jgi:hypothetical protein
VEAPVREEMGSSHVPAAPSRACLGVGCADLILLSATPWSCGLAAVDVMRPTQAAAPSLSMLTASGTKSALGLKLLATALRSLSLRRLVMSRVPCA